MASRRALVISTVVVALAGVGAWYGLEHDKRDAVEKAAAAPVPVTVAIASREDLPVYLTGLGTVQASFTVGIRAQVVGMLQQVMFKEGDYARRGEVRPKIDPRLYRPAPENPKAKRGKDEPKLLAARRDRER